MDIQLFSNPDLDALTHYDVCPGRPRPLLRTCHAYLNGTSAIFQAVFEEA
jgi:hypothetical protein